MAVPKYYGFFNPLLQALHRLGGSASVQEMEDKVSEILKLSDDDISDIHRGNTTKLSYRLAWARNYLKRYGLLQNSSRGVWSLTKKGHLVTKVDIEEVKKSVRNIDTHSTSTLKTEISGKSSVIGMSWQEKMLEVLRELKPSEFERLCQRILREAGFIEVNVVGKSGDGGIDGTGRIRIGGFLSFKVIFQCKRYSGSVGSQQIREFKGTMVGRADKGLFITTGNFTRDAKSEAERDGSPPVDLIDGYLLVEKMKELDLGIRTRNEEFVEVDVEWFKSF